MYYFKKLGIYLEGIIDYPKLKRREKITLSDEDEKQLDFTIESIQKLISIPSPPPAINKPYCKKCSYYEFCYC